MATRNLSEFRTSFNGTRPNRFRIVGTFPQSSTVSASTAGGPPSPSQSSSIPFEVYCKATQLPGSSIGLIPVAWQGRVVKFSGERTYQDWSIQIYDSSMPNHDLRAMFEQWINRMNHREVHTINYDLTSDWQVLYVDNPSQTYSAGHGDTPSEGQTGHAQAILLRNCFPIDLSPIDLSYDLTDTFSEFTVTLAYDFWEYTQGGL
jgi:hypothetical protein